LTWKFSSNTSPSALEWPRNNCDGDDPNMRKEPMSISYFFHLALAVLPKGSTDQQQKVDKISFIISSRFLPSSNG
jgi:hypothetical protein